MTNDSTLTSLRWNGFATDPLTLGVVVEIALVPYGADLFSASYASGSITHLPANNPINEVRLISLPNIVLSAGTYWLTVYGPSILEQHTWLGQTEANGDNSLIQFGPDPNNPLFAFPRNMDARFRIDGDIISTPLPAALPLFATGLAALGLLGWRRKRSRPITQT